MDKHDEILTITELAEWLKIAEKTLYSHAQKGIIPGFKVGSAWRFRRRDIDIWVEEQRRLADESSGKHHPTPEARQPVGGQR
jgi:excisionase family DNA binding protein